MLSAGVQLTILALLIAAFVYGYYERQRRRRIAAENGGFPARTGTMRTGLFECIATPSVCFPSSFSPILAAFNRAEVDGRDCHACDALWAMKTPSHSTTRASPSVPNTIWRRRPAPTASRLCAAHHARWVRTPSSLRGAPPCLLQPLGRQLLLRMPRPWWWRPRSRWLL